MWAREASTENEWECWMDRGKVHCFGGADAAAGATTGASWERREKGKISVFHKKSGEECAVFL